MTKLSSKEMEAYLSEPNVAHLVTMRPNGRPHVAPVWFERSGERVLVMATRSAVKVRNIERNPVAVLSVANNERPYRYLVLEGEAHLTTDDLEGTVHRISTHYVGQERGAAYAQERLAGEGMVVIDLKVERVISWQGTV